MIAHGTNLDRLYTDVGELLEEHRGRADVPALESYRDDPVGFIRDVLGGEPWERQREIAAAVRDRPMVTVRSCHAAGKDWLAARLALWWVYARRGLVVLTGPTAVQVEEIVMRGEIREAFRGSGLPGALHVKALRPGGEGRAGILAKTATGVSALTGFHDARVLFVITEAQDPEIEHAWDAAFACTTGAEDRVLTLGNPTEPVGRFYRAHQPNTDWHAVKIAGDDIPNVEQGETVVPGLLSQEGVQKFASAYGESSPFYISRVLGEFPEETSDSAFPLALVERAMDAHTSASERLAGLDRQAGGEPWTLGVDVAGDGMTGDETVVALRRGPVVYELRAWRGLDTMETVQRVVEIWEELDTDNRARVGEIVVDSIGIGKGVYNRLEETHVTQRRLVGHTRFGRQKWRSTEVRSFDARKSAVGKGDYRNRRSQAYWWLRDKLEDGEIFLPDDEALFEELTRMPYRVDQKGKVWFKKDDLKDRIGRSPDRSDAVAISLWPEVRRSEGKRVWFV